MNGLARASLRFRPAAFAGTFFALMMTSLIVTACGIMLESGLRAEVPAGRYAQVPVVVAADQRAHFTSAGEDESEPVPDAVRLDAALVEKVAALPGVATATPDVSFPIGSERGTLTAHGWASASFSGVGLTAGQAPRPGQVVLPDAKVGSRVTLTFPDGRREFVVSGTAAGDAAWFSDEETSQLSGHPGQITAIAVTPTQGTSANALAKKIEKATGTLAHTGADRGLVEDPALPAAKELLIALGASFGSIAVQVAIFTAAATIALAVGQRSREFALLRAIGATPRQVRRAIIAEAMLVAPVAGLAGFVPGLLLARWWFGQLQERGAIPSGVELSVSAWPLLAAIGIGLVTSLLAGPLAARRATKIKPGQALTESSVPRLRPGIIRTVLGLGTLAGAFVMTVVAARESGEDAANVSLAVVMLFMLAVAFLGPLVARFCAGLAGLPMRAAGASAELAAANSKANARRLASAITPIVLAMAFGSTLVFLHSSMDRATAKQQREGVVADQIVQGDGPGLPAGMSQEIARTPGVEAAVSVLRTGLMVQRTGSLETISAQGVSGDIAAVQDLGVRSGALDRLAPGTVALDAALATDLGLKVGDRFSFRFPDGSKAKNEIVATYARGLGLAQVTLPRETVAPHVSAAFDSVVMVKGKADLTGFGRVTDRSGFAAEQDLDRELNAWANLTMAGVLGGFAAIAALNTLVMTVLDRRRELETLRLIGTTRRQVLLMIRWEALLVTLSGTVIGSAIAAATLIPMIKGLTGGTPYIPPATYAAFVIATLALGALATALPARSVLRRT